MGERRQGQAGRRQGRGGQRLRPRIFIPACLPHTHPGAESGQRTLLSASISQWSGRFTSGARGSGRRGPPLSQRSAPLPGARRRAPPPPRPRLPPPAAAGNWQPLAPAAAAASLPDPTLQLAGARAAAGGVGREGRKRGQGEGPGGRVARSPALLPFCAPCSRLRAAAAAAARGLCTERRT